MELLLSVDNVSVRYDNTVALRHATLKISSSDFIGIIGPNGGGKTTFVKALVGLVPISEGKIERQAGLRVGYLPQHRTLDIDFPVTLQQLILSGLQGRNTMKRHSKKQLQKCKSLMELTGITHLRHRTPKELSGGELQRGLLCRALIADPQLLILDEPTTYVDSGFEQNFYDLLWTLNKKMAILMVSHDLGTICSHVRSIACVNKSVHYHPTAELTSEVLANYQSPLKIVVHSNDH